MGSQPIQGTRARNNCKFMWVLLSGNMAMIPNKVIEKTPTSPCLLKDTRSLEGCSWAYGEKQSAQKVTIMELLVSVMETP